MLISARICVYLCGVLLEDRTTALQYPVFIGEDEQCSVSFPGCTLKLADGGGMLLVDGVAVPEQESFLWESEDVRVVIEPIRYAPMPKEALWNCDIRIPVLFFSLLLVLGTLQSAADVFQLHQEDAEIALAHWFGTVDLSELGEYDVVPNPSFQLDAISPPVMYIDAGEGAEVAGQVESAR